MQESFFCSSLSIWMRWHLLEIDCSAAAVQDSEVLLLSQPKPASAVTPTIVLVICSSARGWRCDVLSRGKPSFVTHRGFHRRFSTVISLVKSYKCMATLVDLKCHEMFCDFFQFVLSWHTLSSCYRPVVQIENKRYKWLSSHLPIHNGRFAFFIFQIKTLKHVCSCTEQLYTYDPLLLRPIHDLEKPIENLSLMPLLNLTTMQRGSLE